MQLHLIVLTTSQEISFLREKILTLESIIIQQAKIISALEHELSKYKTKKNSSNSSLAPSTDIGKPKRNQSLRDKSGKKPGGQLGHQGKTLEWNEKPDDIIEHIPKLCEHCGESLIDKRKRFFDARQLIDIPPILTICTEHQIFEKQCKCGHYNYGTFPLGVQSKVQYGSTIEALVAYLHTRQYMPFGRMQEFFGCIMNLKISTGGINHILHRFTKKCLPIYASIKIRVENALIIGTDETGAAVNGKKGWFWTWQNKLFTFIEYSNNRGFNTIENLFKNGLAKAIIIHDCWAAHFKCVAKGHQVCLSHLIREVNYFIDAYKSDWSDKFKSLIKEALELKKNLKSKDFKKPNVERDKLERRLTKLLKDQMIPPKHKEVITFQNRIIKYRECILLFLYHEYVPPDNNGSERAIRTIKVKQKVSGQFRSEKGAFAFAVIRSIIDTAIKAGKDVFNELTIIADSGPE